MEDDSEPRSGAPSKPSQVPSWVMLGFALGALFVWMLPRDTPTEDTPADVPEEKPVVRTPAVPQLMAVEGLFEKWGQYAVWDGDHTEIAAWNPGTKDFTDFFDVRREGDRYYFRSLPSLTQPLLNHGVPDGSLLHFTETPAQHAQWLKDVGKQNSQTMTEAVINAFSGRPANPPPQPGPLIKPPADGK